MKNEHRQEMIDAAKMPRDAYYYPVPVSPLSEDWGIKSGARDEWICAPVLSKARAELFSASLNNFILR